MSDLKKKGQHKPGRLRYDIVPPEFMDYSARPLTFGIEKGYDEGSWKDFEPEQYMRAGLSHLNDHRRGILIDEESGIPHMMLAVNNFAMLTYILQKNGTIKE